MCLLRTFPNLLHGPSFPCWKQLPRIQLHRHFIKSPATQKIDLHRRSMCSFGITSKAQSSQNTPLKRGLPACCHQGSEGRRQPPRLGLSLLRRASNTRGIEPRPRAQGLRFWVSSQHRRNPQAAHESLQETSVSSHPRAAASTRRFPRCCSDKQGR